MQKLFGIFLLFTVGANAGETSCKVYFAAPKMCNGQATKCWNDVKMQRRLYKKLYNNGYNTSTEKSDAVIELKTANESFNWNTATAKFNLLVMDTAGNLLESRPIRYKDHTFMRSDFSKTVVDAITAAGVEKGFCP